MWDLSSPPAWGSLQGFSQALGPQCWLCWTCGPQNMCWGVLVLLPSPGSLGHAQGKSWAFSNAELGPEVLQGRGSCSSANSSAAPFPLLLTTDIFFPPGIAWLWLGVIGSHSVSLWGSWVSLKETPVIINISFWSAGINLWWSEEDYSKSLSQSGRARWKS